LFKDSALLRLYTNSNSTNASFTSNFIGRVYRDGNQYQSRSMQKRNFPGQEREGIKFENVKVARFEADDTLG